MNTIKITPVEKKAISKFYDIMSNKSMQFAMLAGENLEPKINQFIEIIKKGRTSLIENKFDKIAFKKELIEEQKIFEDILKNIKKDNAFDLDDDYLQGMQKDGEEMLAAINKIKNMMKLNE